MRSSAIELAFGWAPFSFGAHLDYSQVPCEGCKMGHDVFGLSLGFVFMRVLIIARIGCESDE